MNVEISFRPSYSLATIQLNPNERIRAEAGAMVGMSPDVAIETKAEGGLFKSLGRSLLGGESFFQNFYQAGPNGGEISVAPELPGDVFVVDVTEPMLVQSGSYLASETSVEVNTKLSSKAFLSGEGISMLQMTGSGKLLLSSYGAILEKTLAAGEKYIVDTTHLVAFNESMNVEMKSVGGFKSTVLSGEGLVVHITGPGKLYMQTRSPHAFVQWLIPQIPTKSS
jgi:uncharacterized protein (TIGR00266 family)